MVGDQTTNSDSCTDTQASASGSGRIVLLGGVGCLGLLGVGGFLGWGGCLANYKLRLRRCLGRRGVF